METILVLFYMFIMFSLGIVIGWHFGKRGKK